MKNPFPEKIKKIAIVNLASQPDKTKIRKTLITLEKLGIECILAPSVFKQGLDRVLPCSNELRSKSLQDCWLDKSIDLIISARGGYGSAQLCDSLEWPKLAKRKIPVLGYSDITAFHLAMLKYRAGIPVCAPVATQIYDICQCDVASDSLFQALSKVLNPCRRPVRFTDIIGHASGKKINVIKPGQAEGRLIPANLTVFASLVGTSHMPNLKNDIIMLEDVNEPLYKIDRCLNQIKQAGLLASFSGLIFADFHRCGSAESRGAVFAKFAEYVSGPVLSGVPFGHVSPMLSFVVGEKVWLEE